MTDSRWRVATISLAFLLLAVLVAWTMREQAIRMDRERERAEWASIQRGRELRDEQTRGVRDGSSRKLTQPTARTMPHAQEFGGR
jgi:hypothetical protein